MTEIEKLAICSEMARKYISNYYEIIDVEEYNKHHADTLSFHPNGNCGCILLDDDYAFDIRCNHLIWAEGICEPIDDFWTEDDHAIKECDAYEAILVFGNHKGLLSTKLLVFHENLQTDIK